MKEYIQQLSPDKLMPFQKHPYQVREDAAMDELVESIRVHGVLSPLLARPKGDGYELVSGHRRRLAAQKLGLKTVPVLVREMTDDEAVILMVDSNLQRENLLPSEKAFAYKMKLEAIKHQGKATSRQVVGKLESADEVGQGMRALWAEFCRSSACQAQHHDQRYQRLSKQLPDAQRRQLLRIVDAADAHCEAASFEGFVAGFCLAAGIARETMRDRYSYEDAIEARGQFRR